MKKSILAALLPLAGLVGSPAYAQDLSAEVVELREMVSAMRADYEQRIAELEARLDKAERASRGARRDAEEAYELAEQTAISQTGGSSAPNAFNPGIGMILTGKYADIGAGWDEIPGFQPSGEIGTGETGFMPGELEFNLRSNIDSSFYGNATFALAAEDGEVEVELEEAWLQTTSLPGGLTLMGGRFFSGAGYLNGFHLHADDFVDRPLPYQAFLGGTYKTDGLQARWVAPTNLLVELGAEMDWGGGFPSTANAGSSPGSHTLFVNVGGDMGDSNSWKAGVSHTSTDAVDRPGGEDDPATFTGDSDLTVVNAVWKWAPQGNPTIHNVKFQGEYFRRDEKGLYDGLAYDGDQDGWYLQGIWQFAPMWRVGLRRDVVDASNGPLFAGTALEDPGRRSSRSSVMFDWSPSEFGRLRLQYTDDRVLAESDTQWFLQYIMSLGAHGAHQF